MVTCQWGLAACRAPDTWVISAVRPCRSALPSPSKSKLTPSRFFAETAAISAADKRAPALGSEVMESSELWLKSVTVSTTRSPAAWDLLTRLTRSWLSYPFHPEPLSSSVPSGLASTLKYASVVRLATSKPDDCGSVQYGAYPKIS